MNRSRCFRRNITGNSTGERKLLKQSLQAGFILRNVGIKFGVGSFKVSVGDHAGTAVAWPSNVDAIQIVFLDDAVEVRIDEIQPGRRTEMPEQPGFNMLGLQWLAQQRRFI